MENAAMLKDKQAIVRLKIRAWINTLYDASLDEQAAEIANDTLLAANAQERKKGALAVLDAFRKIQKKLDLENLEKAE